MLTSSAPAEQLAFSEPNFPPGDDVIGAAAGMQVESDIARGGDQFLAVWSDGRSSPDDYWPFATEGSGTDIYGVRLDTDGNLIDTHPIVINQDFGDQIEPRVAWNGENWLVLWHGPLDSYYDSLLQAVRVAPDGTILDDPPIALHYSDYEFANLELAGGAGGWMVLVQSTSGWDSALRGFAVAGDGSRPIPGGIIAHETSFMIDFDLAFAQDEYLVVWSGSFDSPRGRRYAPDLQPLGAEFALPFADKVASDGNNFLVVWASGSPPLATVDAVLVSHNGQPHAPFTIYTAPGQAGTCCANVTWDGTCYWTTWGQTFFARVSAEGQLLDPGGLQYSPDTYPISTPHFAGASAGGLRLVWNDGVSGADYPKDVFSGRVGANGDLVNESLVSMGAPTQFDAEFAEGESVHLVAFRSRTSESGRILAHRLDASGAALDDEPIEVASGPIPGLGLPSLGPPAAAWNGSVFMVTWSNGFEIFARRMLPDGSFVDETPLTIMDGFDPDVAAVGEVFLVVGIDFLNDNTQWQATHAMRVDGPTGQNLDPMPNPIGGFVIFAQHPHVVGWEDRWLATWQTNASHDEPNASVRGALVEADGSAPGGVFFVSFGGWRPDVAVSDNEALFVWSNGSIASADSNIQGRRMLPDGTFPGAEFIVAAAPDRQLYPVVTWNGTEFIAAWQDKRNSVTYFDERTDIYGARVTAGGTLIDTDSVPIAIGTLPEVWPELMSSGSTTLLASSILDSVSDFFSYRIGIQLHDYSHLGDLNDDSMIDAADLALLLGSWGPCAGCPADLNEDGVVNAADLALLLGNWS